MERLSVLPVSFFPALHSGEMTVEQWACMGKKYGLKYVDFPVWAFRDHTPVYILRQKAILDDMGIRIGSISTHSDLTNPDKIQRCRELDYLRHDMALASELCASYLRITDGQAHPGLDIYEGLNYAYENLLAASEVAKNYGVKLALENHGFPSAWIYNDFSHDLTIFLKLADMLRGTEVGINFDCANATGCGADAAAMLENIYSQVVSVHIADTSSTNTTVHTALGAGVCPIKDVLNILYTRGFSGLVSIEEDSGNGESGIFQAIEHVRGIWNSFAKS